MQNEREFILDKTTNIVVYNGYKIFLNGDIISPNGKILSAYTLTYPGSHVTMKINGKVQKKNKALLVYNAFSEKKADLNKYVIKFKDGNTYNTSFGNLYLVSRKEYYAEREFKGQSKFTDIMKKEIRKEYKIGKLSIRKLCSKYQCSLLTMQKILRETS